MYFVPNLYAKIIALKTFSKVLEQCSKVISAFLSLARISYVNTSDCEKCYVVDQMIVINFHITILFEKSKITLI